MDALVDAAAAAGRRPSGSSPGHRRRAARRRDSRSSADSEGPVRSSAPGNRSGRGGEPLEEKGGGTAHDEREAPGEDRPRRIEDRRRAFPRPGPRRRARARGARSRGTPRARARGRRGRRTRSARRRRRAGALARGPRAGSRSKSEREVGARPSRTRASSAATSAASRPRPADLIGLRRVGEAVAENECPPGERGPQRPRATCWRRAASIRSHSAIGSSSVVRDVHQHAPDLLARSACRPARGS